ncbi:hypothetical protein GCM10011612_05520 [Actinomyces gaoshouyii]|uniref:Uncharacterized protein n=1 Tax=Actinomyces gaoshouyii TaxID=1960083 RepID=A0A8H9H7I4_9ACTO|nr:hypothetical protein GCM10011612_05520 [Actinomyces gaoshouyii]
MLRHGLTHPGPGANPPPWEMATRRLSLDQARCRAGNPACASGYGRLGQAIQAPEGAKR